MDASKPKPSPRKLVSARCISKIKPLSSSGTHEVVMVDSWPVVVPIGQFEVGQLVLYFEIDSFLPFDDKRYEPYRSSHTSATLHGKKGWVVQTVKLADHISQGMVFRIDDQFPEVTRIQNEIVSSEDSDLSDDGENEVLSNTDLRLMTKDLTDELRVTKWRTFYLLYGSVDLGKPPSFLLDMKLERAQNLRNLWETHGNTEFEITEMLDGPPMTVYQVNEGDGAYQKLPGMLKSDKHFDKRSGLGISIGSYDCAETKLSHIWGFMRAQGVLSALKDLSPSQVVLGGVFCAATSCSNPRMRRWRKLYVHSISDPGSMKRLNSEEAFEWQKKLNFRVRFVPAFSRRIRLSAFAQSIDELVMKAEGNSDVCSHDGLPTTRKGLVFKALDGSINFKAISNEWLLGETEKLREIDEDARRRPGPNECV